MYSLFITKTTFSGNRDLKNKDVMSKSDPVCVIYMKETGQDRFYEIGRTEMVKDSLSPQWMRKFEVDYRFEERQVSYSFA